MNISCSFKIFVCVWLSHGWEWMEGKWRTRLFLLLVGEIFQEDAQYKSLALTQLMEKSQVPFQCATFLQLPFSEGTSREKTKMRKYEILT